MVLCVTCDSMKLEETCELAILVYSNLYVYDLYASVMVLGGVFGMSTPHHTENIYIMS